MQKQLSFLFILILFLSLAKSSYAITAPKINEFVAHPSSSVEWVEFYNPDHTDMSGYYVDDDTDFANDSGSSTKKSLSTLNNTNPEFPYIELSSVLNNTGDYVVLFDGSGNIVDQYNYDSDPGVDTAIGRSPDGTGAFAVLAASTKGSANSPVLPTPTPTPTDVPSPTPTTKPSPTNTPSPTPKTPTATPTLKPSSTPRPPTVTPTDTQLEGANDGAVLNDKTTPTDEPSPTTAVLGVSTHPNVIAIGFFVVGGILFVTCGILLFRQFWLSRQYESEDNN